MLLIPRGSPGRKALISATAQASKNKGECKYQMKAKDHVQLTRKTLEVFDELSQDDFSAELLKTRHEVEIGAEREDFSPLYTRITNWHFYKQNEHLCPGVVYFLTFLPLKVTPTSELILTQRIGELLQILHTGSPRRLGRAIGRILHHIQDMSSPAHVVPVYHDPQLQDSFEEYSCRNIAPTLKSIDITRKDLDGIHAEKQANIFQIYCNAANTTLKYLFEDHESRFTLNSESEVLKMGWDLFWKRANDVRDDCWRQPYKALPGFGCYGPLGGNYGDATVDLKGKVCRIDPETFRKLYRWVVRKQLIDSLRTLIAVKSLMNSA